MFQHSYTLKESILFKRFVGPNWGALISDQPTETSKENIWRPLADFLGNNSGNSRCQATFNLWCVKSTEEKFGGNHRAVKLGTSTACGHASANASVRGASTVSCGRENRIHLCDFLCFFFQQVCWEATHTLVLRHTRTRTQSCPLYEDKLCPYTPVHISRLGETRNAEVVWRQQL